ncbi:MAG: nitroreductase family protein [Bifidobacterium sp.]|nr:nitroreductase family protein [Bifidobacterium sp.]
MDLTEAIDRRHTVRRYQARPLEPEAEDTLREAIREVNRRDGLCLKLVTGTGDGVNAMGRLMGRHINNYVILAGPESPGLGRLIGYRGAELMLLAQTLGLNTWWVGGFVSERGVRRHLLDPEAKVLGVLVVGYGATQGEPHRTKVAEDISSYDGHRPKWFDAGVNALLKAPSALNRQPFVVEGAGNVVRLSCEDSAMPDIDLGIARFFFELGAGPGTFVWA